MADEYYHNGNQYGYQDALFHGCLLLKNKGARQGLPLRYPCGFFVRLLGESFTGIVQDGDFRGFYPSGGRNK